MILHNRYMILYIIGNKWYYLIDNKYYIIDNKWYYKQ